MPTVYGWPLILLALAGAVTIIIRRSKPGFVALIGFLIVYLLFTADDPYWLPVARFTVLMAPLMAVIAAFSLGIPFFRTRLAKIWLPLWGVIGVFPLLTWSPNPNYFPFDQLVKELLADAMPPGRLVVPHFWPTPFSVYCNFYGLRNFRLVTPKWKPSKWHSAEQDLSKLCATHNCDYLVLAGRRSPAGRVSVLGMEDLDFASISMNNIKGFVVLKTFWFWRNFLTIAKPMHTNSADVGRVYPGSL
jgi:hypothetical protein